MLFQRLAVLLDELERTASRNSMTEQLAMFLKEVPKDEVTVICYLLLGRLGPLFAQVDFGVAEKTAIKSIARVVGMTEEEVRKKYKEMGDAGELVFQLKTQSSKLKTDNELTVNEVYEQLMRLARTSGVGSQEEKIHQLSQLLIDLNPLEAKFVMRMVLGKMRLGFSDKTILDALAVMDGGSKQGRSSLDWAYQVSPDIGLIASLVKTYGVTAVAGKVQATVGVPVLPCLAQRLRSADEMINKMTKVMVEAKYDGTRVQIHFAKQNEKHEARSTKHEKETANYMIKTYARSLEETTAMFPELEGAVNQINAESVIIDCEAVGYDPQTGKLKNFQETITRKRKYGVAETSQSIPIKFFCFDLLFLNGESLLHKPLYERRQLLDTVVDAGSTLIISPMIVTESADELRRFHQVQLDAGLEGAMVKKYDGEYQPGRTGWNWVKFKDLEATNGQLSDTVDGVVMGYYRGRGKRSAFGIGAFLIGILNEKTNHFVTVAKIGTGLSDEQWRQMKRRVDECFAMSKPTTYVVPDGLMPDVWAEPAIVVEVAADEITKSPLHSSGWGLRFPRLVRFRDDKTVEQVTSPSELDQIRGI